MQFFALLRKDAALHSLRSAMNGEWDYQIQQGNDEENYKQIKTYFMFYIFTIHSSQYNNKQKNKLLFTFLLFVTLESKAINARQ